MFEPGSRAVSPRVPEWALSTVVGNLLTNAIKYTEGGQVGLAVDAPPGQGVEISVTDTGIGMDGEMLSKLTSPWVRARQVVAQGRERQGLGLTLADWAARAIGGRLAFSSEPGIGTRALLAMKA